VSGRVVVVGAGITGLTAAYRLLAHDGERPEVVVLEAEDRLGGKIASARVGGVELEAGPDSLLGRKPWGVELCRELGLGGDLVASAPVPTHIWTDAGLLRFPSGPFGITTDPWELWRWPGMSRRGKVRAAADLVLRGRRETSDESLGTLLRRRIGDEATETLVAPLLGGLFAGDVDRMSVAATFPELAVWERRHGSLFRGARAAAHTPTSGARAPMFLRLRGGLKRLTDALAERVGRERIRTSTPVTAIRHADGGYVVEASRERLGADAVVVASPAFATADLVEASAPEVAAELRAIRYVSTSVVLMVYADRTAAAVPESSGFVVPRGKLAMTACTIVSRKWPDPSFGRRAVVRCFVGAEGSEELVDEPDEDIVDGVGRQVARLLGVPERPEHAAVVRWRRAMPQYDVGHVERVDRIEAGLPEGLVVAGQAYRGAGIPDCVRQGGEVADRVRSHLSRGVKGERVG
jgi:protoporphyrinogen/coproporphyrinogen III oxidase